MIKEIFQKRLFWVILVILLLAVFIYPPFIGKSPSGNVVERSCGWFFSPPKIEYRYMDLDLKTLLVEAIIAILLSIGICLIPFHKGNKKSD